MVEPVIRLDKGKEFSTNHGIMTPDDPHYHVAYWQGGTLGGHKVRLPFDVQGELVPDDARTEPWEGIDSEGKKTVYRPLYSPLMRRYLEARRKRMAEMASAAPDPNAIDEETAHDEDFSVAAPKVDFKAWLRGEIKYQPHLLRSAARETFGHAYQEIYPNLVVDLVLDEHLVPEDQVADHLRKYLPKKAPTEAPASAA